MSSYTPVYFGSDGISVEYGSSESLSIPGIELSGRLHFAAAGAVSGYITQIFSTGADQNLVYDVPATYAHYMRIGNVDSICAGHSFWGGSTAEDFGIGWWGTGGDGTSYSTRSGIRSYGKSYISHNANVGHLFGVGGTDGVYFSSSGFVEAGKLAVGGTLGSSPDPGSGGIYCSGTAKMERLILGTSAYWIDPGMGSIHVPGLIRFYSGYGASIADNTLPQIYSDGGAIFQNVNSGQYLGSKIAGTLKFTLGYSSALGTFGAGTFQLGDPNALILSNGSYVAYICATSNSHYFSVAGSNKLVVGANNASERLTICSNVLSTPLDPGAAGLYVGGNSYFIGGQSLGKVTKTTTYTLTANDHLCICDSSTPFTVTLPYSGGGGQTYIIKNKGTGAVTLSRQGSTDLIDGVTTKTLNQYDAITVVDSATNVWSVI